MGKDKKKGKPITDPRFSSASYDPRFNVPSLKRNKVKVDERFSKEELKKLNARSGLKEVNIDRYGRKLKDKESDFDKYFVEEGAESETKDNLSDDEDAPEEQSGEEDGSESESEETETNSASENDLEVEPGYLDRARGEGLVSSDDDDSSEEEVSDVEDELDEKPAEGDPTPSFAVVNMDWDNVRAVDLMATFASFAPKGAAIQSVAVYPSEFGKEQMQKEEIQGPPKELFRNKKKDTADLDSDDDLDLTNKEDLEKAARKLYEEDDGKEDYDHKALRKYQLQRLRYYYAVVVCDDVTTAKNIYDNCDGTEYESTANMFDLRYIPDGMEFDESEARDICTKIPSSYRPDSAFVTDALQHSKVKLTWDETPKERVTLASRAFSQKEIDDMDFKAYLASDSEDEEGDADLKSKYQSLVGGKFRKKADAEDASDDEGDVDMEITFNPGLDENAVPEPEKEETTIEAYKRKEKERRTRRMEHYKAQKNEEAADAENDKKGKRDKKDKKDKNKKKSKPTAEDDRARAELELLVSDNENETEHFNMRDIIKAEKKKGKKTKKSTKDSGEVQDNFQVDLSDPRFSEVFENHEYAIDPTSADFKKTQTMKKILSERSKRRDGSKKRKDRDGDKTKKPEQGNLASLVDKVKRHKH